MAWVTAHWCEEGVHTPALSNFSNVQQAKYRIRVVCLIGVRYLLLLIKDPYSSPETLTEFWTVITQAFTYLSNDFKIGSYKALQTTPIFANYT